MVSVILGLDGPILFPTEDRTEENTDPRGVTLRKWKRRERNSMRIDGGGKR
jgi:hypothetical protein